MKTVLQCTIIEIYDKRHPTGNLSDANIYEFVTSCRIRGVDRFNHVRRAALPTRPPAVAIPARAG